MSVHVLQAVALRAYPKLHLSSANIGFDSIARPSVASCTVASCTDSIASLLIGRCVQLAVKKPPLLATFTYVKPKKALPLRLVK